MKKLSYISILLFTLNLSSLMAGNPISSDTIPFDREIIDKHSQLYPASMIPSAVEMILKLNNKVPFDYFDNQKMWRNNMSGNFINFDSISIKGIRFNHKFSLKRGDSFPIDQLFSTIDQELAEKRFVMISLKKDNHWSVHIIYGKTGNDEYVAFTKAGKKTMFERRVKEIVKQMKGTDIMIYSVE